MLNPRDFGLKENPFGNLPGAEVTHWAGMPKTKEALADVVSSVRPDDIGASECVVLQGDYGAGKSHALRFFAGQINQDKSDNAGRAIYLSEVTGVTSPSFSALYPKIIGQIGGEVQNRVATSVHRAVDKCAQQISTEASIKISHEEAIRNRVIEEDQEQVRSLRKSKGFLELQDAKNGIEAAQKLASIFRVMTTPIGDTPPAYGSACLFLDEMESVNEAKVGPMMAFYEALRALVNGVNERFALVLSFSMKVAVLEATIPPFMNERLTRPYIECAALSPEDAKVFVKEYLEPQRAEGFSHKNSFHPFSETAIDAIFEREPTLIPRRILMHMRRVWERASRREGLQPGAEISREMAGEILTGIGV